VKIHFSCWRMESNELEGKKTVSIAI